MRNVIVLLALAITLSAHAEQKNVKLLTGLSDLKLQRTMNLMRGSLGTHCDYCHVIKEEWDFASDEKPTKERAREMIQMVMNLNRTQFGGRAVISCYTCHRGATHPVNLLPLPQTAPPFPTPVPEKVQPPETKALIARYASALGDAARFGATVFAGEATKGETKVPIEIRQKGTKVQQLTKGPKGTMEQAFDGASYWVRDADGIREMPTAGQESFRALIDAFALPLPSDIGEESTAFRIEKVGERDAWVVQKGNPHDAFYRRFYFDIESGLLVRSVVHTPRPVGTVPQQTDFEDYRDVAGTKVPFRVRVSFVDPWSSVTRQYTSVQLGARIDDGIFVMPK